MRRHLLAPARSLAADPQSVLTVVERLGLLQFDPLEVPGARNHDLVLHARVGGYRREWTDQWLYGAERRLIELYNKSLNLVPLAELPWYRLTWDRNRPQYEEGILNEQAAVAEAILARIESEGAHSTASFAEHGHAIDWWWAPTRAARAVEEQMRHRLLSRYRATGLTTPTAQAEVMYSAGSAAERRTMTAELVEQGVLAEVALDGVRGPYYVLAEELPMLELPDRIAQPTVAFIAPLDPLAWDRRLLRDLWHFDYLWEVYVPQAKRRWGYYVLPVLFGDRLVGRIEPRIDRRQKALRIIGLSWQEGFSPRAEDGFVDAFDQALSAYSAFVGAEHVEWQASQP